MLDVLHNLLRRARLRSGREAAGKVQTFRAESLDNDAKDQAERWQDYGFAAQPVDGQGLVIHAGGHTIVLRMDRLAERPELAVHEVAVWHKEGHMIKLKNDGLIEMTGTTLNVVMASAVNITAQAINLTSAPDAHKHNGINIGQTHVHTEVQRGSANTGVPP